MGDLNRRRGPSKSGLQSNAPPPIRCQLSDLDDRAIVAWPGETEVGSAGTQPNQGIARPTVRRWMQCRAPVGPRYRSHVFPSRFFVNLGGTVRALTACAQRNTRHHTRTTAIEHRSHASENPVARMATLFGMDAAPGHCGCVLFQFRPEHVKHSGNRNLQVSRRILHRQSTWDMRFRLPEERVRAIIPR